MPSALKKDRSSPTSVKFLILTYIFTFGEKLHQVTLGESSTKLAFLGAILVLAISTGILIGIFMRIPWIWIAGLADSLYSTLYASFKLLHQDSGAVSATQSLLMDPNSALEMSPEQIEMLTNFDLFGSGAFLLIGALGTAWLWWVTRSYFEGQEN